MTGFLYRARRVGKLRGRQPWHAARYACTVPDFLEGTRMASFTSFYFAIFRKFQAICGAVQQGHVNADSAPWDQLYGGFSLQSTQDPQGIFGQLGPQASHYPPLSP